MQAVPNSKHQQPLKEVAQVVDDLDSYSDDDDNEDDDDIKDESEKPTEVKEQRLINDYYGEVEEEEGV